MARNVFDLTPKEPPSNKDRPEAKTPSKQPPSPPQKTLRPKGGAPAAKYMQAAAQGAADRTYQDVPIGQIRESAIRDRIDVSEDLQSLAESISEKGQQIPIIVRMVEGDQPYEIIVGRRRLAALRLLGEKTVKAFVRKVNAREAFEIQGIENNERLETSFIERARAADQALSEEYTAVEVGTFMSVTKQLVHMSVRIYRDLGEEIVTAIGPARGVGRRRWQDLAEAIVKSDLELEEIVSLIDRTLSSVDRFDALKKSLDIANASQPTVTSPRPKPKPITKALLDGVVMTTRKPGQLVVKSKSELPESILDEVQAFLENRLSQWKKEEAEK